VRRLVQFGFLALTLVGVFVVRGNAERWCPFGGIEALYGYVREGNLLCSLGVSNFYILAAVLVVTLLFRRAFCGYVCPLGTISEWLGRAADGLGLRAARVPRGVDRVLGLLKYAVLGIIVYVTWRAGELLFRGFDPCYALLSRHGEDITLWAYIVAGAMVAGALLVTMPFCRWLCPLAAVLSPFSRVALTRIRRHKDSCINCSECAAVCPMAIPVGEVEQVTAARCISCLRCLDACPTSAAGVLTWGPPGRSARPWPQAALIAMVLLSLGGAVAASYAFPLPSFVQTRAAGPDAAAPGKLAALELRIENVTCRGRATLLAGFLERDDDFAIPGYLKLEAWPGPGAARVRVTYDASRTDEAAIKEAITEPYFDAAEKIWRMSPFVIQGYDSLGLD
jgi:polyferredoxin